ncbi:hypothetical protein MMC28_010339, partial [Mycoblastus sanguinarius]|nr:hypothetical protein [Mycoblastus sanguinarius]
MDCDSQYFLYGGISDTLSRIDHPTDLGDLIRAMSTAANTIRHKEVDPVPDGRDWTKTGGWSLDPESVQTVLDQVPLEDFGFSQPTPIMVLREKGKLLFRQDFEHYIWDQISMYRIDKPAMLSE